MNEKQHDIITEIKDGKPFDIHQHDVCTAILYMIFDTKMGLNKIWDNMENRCSRVHFSHKHYKSLSSIFARCLIRNNFKDVTEYKLLDGQNSFIIGEDDQGKDISVNYNDFIINLDFSKERCKSTQLHIDIQDDNTALIENTGIIIYEISRDRI